MIVVIDYGMGNLHSVTKALEHLGATVSVGSTPEALAAADKLVLPGVGAFGDAMQELNKRHLSDPIREFIRNGKPFLGICLGQQLLFPESEENPGISGLGVCRGCVQKFQSNGVKIPHMGWNQIHIRKPHPLLAGIPDSCYFYFVHSFYVVPESAEMDLATCRYGDESFAAVIGNDTMAAIQFHPEKSQEAGLTLLKNFIAWSPS